MRRFSILIAIVLASLITSCLNNEFDEINFDFNRIPGDYNRVAFPKNQTV